MKLVDLQVTTIYQCLDCEGRGDGEAWAEHVLANACKESRMMTTVRTVHGTFLGEFEEVDEQVTAAPYR